MPYLVLCLFSGGYMPYTGTIINYCAPYEHKSTRLCARIGYMTYSQGITARVRGVLSLASHKTYNIY